MNGIWRKPSGRSATASCPGPAALPAMQCITRHLLCGRSGVPSGQYNFQLTHYLSLPIKEVRLANSCGRLTVIGASYRRRRGIDRRNRTEQFVQAVSLSRSAASERLCSVISRAIFDAPTTQPANPHRRHGQRDIDKRSVLPPTDGLVMVDTFAAAKPLEFWLLVEAIGGDQDGNRLTDYFFFARYSRKCARHRDSSW